MQIKRSAIIVGAVVLFLLIATAAVVIPMTTTATPTAAPTTTATSAPSCPPGQSRSNDGTCLVPKSNNPADYVYPELKPPAPAPVGPAETAPPAPSIYVDQDLSEVAPFVGTISTWNGTDTTKPMLAADITPEGYQRLLNIIGYQADSEPSGIWLSKAAAESIGISSDDPEAMFTLSVRR